MVANRFGVRCVTAQVLRVFARSAVLAVLLVMAVALASCGRKGGLDAPPSAAIDQPATSGSNQAGAPQTGFTSDGRPISAPTAKKRLPMDVLLD